MYSSFKILHFHGNLYTNFNPHGALIDIKVRSDGISGKNVLHIFQNEMFKKTYIFIYVCPQGRVCVAGTLSLRRLGMPRYDVWLWHLHAGPPSHLSCIYFCPGRLKLRRRRLQRWALKPSPPRDLWLIGVPKMISKRASGGFRRLQSLNQSKVTAGQSGRTQSENWHAIGWLPECPWCEDVGI